MIPTPVDVTEFFANKLYTFDVVFYIGMLFVLLPLLVAYTLAWLVVWASAIAIWTPIGGLYYLMRFLVIRNEK